ncbi:hypothetical protein, partial [Plasmodium yoelii yoelii]
MLYIKFITNLKIFVFIWTYFNSSFSERKLFIFKVVYICWLS